MSNQRVKLTNVYLSLVNKGSLRPSESLQDTRDTLNLPNFTRYRFILCLVSIWEKAEQTPTKVRERLLIAWQEELYPDIDSHMVQEGGPWLNHPHHFLKFSRCLEELCHLKVTQCCFVLNDRFICSK